MEGFLAGLEGKLAHFVGHILREDVLMLVGHSSLSSAPDIFLKYRNLNIRVFFWKREVVHTQDFSRFVKGLRRIMADFIDCVTLDGMGLPW